MSGIFAAEGGKIPVPFRALETNALWIILGISLIALVVAYFLAKLKSIPDGLRHVRYMLAHAPAAWFLAPALALAVAGAALLVAGHARGAAAVAGAVLLALAAMVGQAWYGLRLYARLAHGSGGPKPPPAWLRFARPVATILGLACLGIAVGVAAGGEAGSLGSEDGTGTLLAIAVGIVILSSVVWVASLQRVIARKSR